MNAKAKVQWVDKDSSTDNVSLSAGFDLMGTRPCLDATLLSAHLHLWGQPLATSQSFSNTTMPPGFRWAFCSLGLQNAGCGLSNNT